MKDIIIATASGRYDKFYTHMPEQFEISLYLDDDGIGVMFSDENEDVAASALIPVKDEDLELMWELDSKEEKSPIILEFRDFVNSDVQAEIVERAKTEETIIIDCDRNIDRWTEELERIITNYKKNQK